MVLAGPVSDPIGQWQTPLKATYATLRERHLFIWRLKINRFRRVQRRIVLHLRYPVQ